MTLGSGNVGRGRVGVDEANGEATAKEGGAVQRLSSVEEKLVEWALEGFEDVGVRRGHVGLDGARGVRAAVEALARVRVGLCSET